MAANTVKQTKLSAFRGKPQTGYQEQVFSEQLTLRYPATLQSVGQSLGYSAIQGYFTVPKPEPPAAPVIPQNLITQVGDFLTTETGNHLTTQ
jgi:hypothetical protein